MSTDIATNLNTNGVSLNTNNISNSNNGTSINNSNINGVNNNLNGTKEFIGNNLDNLNNQDEEETPEVDINISNVVCNFSTRCHLNLRQIAMNGINVEYRREQGVVSMKLRHPKVTASIWSSGKITVTGSTSENEAKIAARKVARILQKMSFKVKFSYYRIVNVLGSVILPFGIRIAQFTEENRNICSYEPEIHPGATYKFKDVSATLKIFQTGAITITAPSVHAVQLAVEHIYPLVYIFKKDKPPQLNPIRKRVLMDNNLNNDNTINGVQNKKKRRIINNSSEEDENPDDIINGFESDFNEADVDEFN